MYNGIGLPTPRGSGTSGYIQRNLGHVQPSRVSKKPTTKSENTGSLKVSAGGDPELLEHERRRQVEIELLGYIDELEDRGITGEELDDLVERKRETMLKQEAHVTDEKSPPEENETKHVKRKRQIERDTHLRAQEKRREDERMRKALKLK